MKMRTIFPALALAFASGLAHANLIAHWKFDEASGTTAGDSAGSNNGTLSGSPLPTRVTGTGGSAIDFSGVKTANQVVQAPVVGLPTGNSARTISLWLNADATATDQKFFSYGNSQAGRAFSWTLEPGPSAGTGTIFFRHVAPTGQTGNRQFTGTAVALNTWTHVAMVVPDGAATTGDVLLFLNGAPVTGTTTAVTLDTASSQVAIGGGGSVYSSRLADFNGRIDDVQVYSRTLNAAQIQSLHDNPGSFIPNPTVEPDPTLRITSITINPFADTAVLALDGEKNTNYDIFSSTDLADWGLPIGTSLTDGAGIGTFTDTSATEPAKFYQARNQSPPPNLVVVFTDDQTVNAIGYNNPAVLTPNIDSLAAQGLIFDRACVATPICVASRASLMSGQFPQQNGIYALNTTPFDAYKTGGPKAGLTLAAQIKALGYRTVAYGKSHLGAFTGYGFDQGMETPEDDDTGAFAQAAAFLASSAAKQQPFLLWLAPRQPHVPLLPEQQWLDLYDASSLVLPPNFRTSPLQLSINNQGTPGQNFYRDSTYTSNWMNLPAGPTRSETVMKDFTKAYYAVLSRLDSQVGTMVQQLKNQGLWDNTILVFLSDNGYHLGSHGLGNKITMHEESVRVPMFVVGPGVAAGQRTSALVSTLDLHPTLLRLAGADSIPAHVAGLSLHPILGNPSARIRDTVFSECVGVGGGAGQGHRMARSANHKYVLTDTNEEYLFDLHADPFELVNRISDPALTVVRDELRDDLETWMLEIGDRAFPY